MKTIVFFISAALFSSIAFSQKEQKPVKNRIESKIDTTAGHELVLIQTFTVNAPIGAVWDAYTTAEGWMGWAVPIAEVDFKVGGTIKTNYDKNASIEDSTTIVLHIINYVPKAILTLQAEITENFPEFMKNEAADFYNVIQFQEAGKNKTQVISYGIGYKNTAKYLSLMTFFIQANEHSLMSLIDYLEKK